MKINILFIKNMHKRNAKGLCVLMCRLTYNKIRKSYGTGLFINPDYWNSKQQAVKPLESDSEYINSQLSLIKTKINRAFLLLQVKEESFNVDDIYSLYKGVKHKRRSKKSSTEMLDFFVFNFCEVRSNLPRSSITIFYFLVRRFFFEIIKFLGIKKIRKLVLPKISIFKELRCFFIICILSLNDIKS